MASWAPKDVTPDPKFDASKRWPSVYDICPDCGGPKAKKAYRCRACTPLTRGENAPNWKGDRASTTTKRERAGKLYPELGTCEDCGKAPAVDRHHIDGDTGNNERTNVAFLCRRCHMEADGRLEALHAREREIKPPQPCIECGKPYKPLRRGLCHACNERRRRAERKPDPRPERRQTASKKQWETIRKHFAYQCCVHCGLASNHLHHIAYRSEGGGDVIENLCVLCNSCHERFHRHSEGWERVAAAIRQYVIASPERRRYAEDTLKEHFGRRYPPLENTDERFWLDFRGMRPVREPEVEL